MIAEILGWYALVHVAFVLLLWIFLMTNGRMRRMVVGDYRSHPPSAVLATAMTVVLGPMVLVLLLLVRVLGMRGMLR